MDSLFTLFITSFAIAFSGAVAPGPVLSVTITETLKRGFIAGPAIILGHGILEGMLIGLLLAGPARLLASPGVLPVMGLIGGVVLVLMAVQTGRQAASAGLAVFPASLPVREKASFSGGPVVLGMITSMANPYWLIWWVTVGLSYLLISLEWGALGLMVFFTGHIAADLLWYGGISFALSQGARRLTAGVYRGIVGSCALLLLFFGVYFIIWSIGQRT